MGGLAGRRGGGVLELLVDRVDLEEALGADGRGDGCLVSGVDTKGLADAVDGDVDRVLLLGLEGAVGEGGREEVADGQREALLWCCGLVVDC